jgi:hypothetical protein
MLSAAVRRLAPRRCPRSNRNGGRASPPLEKEILDSPLICVNEGPRARTYALGLEKIRGSLIAEGLNLADLDDTIGRRKLGAG